MVMSELGFSSSSTQATAIVLGRQGLRAAPTVGSWGPTYPAAVAGSVPKKILAHTNWQHSDW